MEMNAAHLHTEEESSRYVPARADATFLEADYRAVLWKTDISVVINKSQTLLSLSASL